MSTFKPRVFLSTNPAAPVLDGQAGSLISVLDHALTIGKVFSYNGSIFTDNTVEARLDGGTAFPLFPDGDTDDILYLGHSVKFSAAAFDLATLGVGGTYMWEYWNGAWVTLTKTDGTNGLTQDGVMTWTPPADWVTTSVNSVTMYWIRIRCTGAPSTNPTTSSITSTGWLIYFTGTNKRAYRTSPQGGGNRLYLRVDDTGTVDGRVVGYETMSDVDTGTGLFPTQVSGGLFWKKSNTGDATARPWVVIADDRTMYLFTLNGGVANTYAGVMFGDFYSYVPGDSYRTALIGHAVTTNTAAHYRLGLACRGETLMDMFPSVPSGFYLARGYQGVASSIEFAPTSDKSKQSGNSLTGFDGLLTFPNPADGGLYLSPVEMYEQVASTLAHIRGRYRGLWCPLHAITFASDGDTFSGAGALAGRTFRTVKSIIGGDGTSTANSGVGVVETSDTWDTN